MGGMGIHRSHVVADRVAHPEYSSRVAATSVNPVVVAAGEGVRLGATFEDYS